MKGDFCFQDHFVSLIFISAGTKGFNFEKSFEKTFRFRVMGTNRQLNFWLNVTLARTEGLLLQGDPMLSLGGHTPNGTVPIQPQPTTQRRSSNTEERRLQAVPSGFKVMFEN